MLALLRGRAYVLPEDVQALVHDIVDHRLVLTFDALADGVTAASVVDQILAAVPLPRVIWDDVPESAPARP